MYLFVAFDYSLSNWLVCLFCISAGSGQLKEWVALESEGDKPPRIRFAHPMTAIQFEGTRKRRRAAIGDYAWSVGDRVDVWVQNWYVNMILNIMFVGWDNNHKPEISRNENHDKLY